ncbi:hypothetical protein EKO29_05145 [Colwellia sp. Arc7-635]|uniref:hypothetical protein n=1 Tax=Colwellia sp. Arc7-635 TaxID=2497879 RepID=UPI000F84FF04|nr:hypothetical protein [Colwellia sp. Arc7-635]AZQ83486.1 hypothetical protein EKO29_05145 [Colwellia sp. Arc7-635]
MISRLSTSIKSRLILTAMSPVVAIAKATIIKNIQGYPTIANKLKSFLVISLTVDKIYTTTNKLPTTSLVMIDG